VRRDRLTSRCRRTNPSLALLGRLLAAEGQDVIQTRESAVANCPICKTAVPLWTVVKQTNWSTFICLGCGTRLRISRTHTFALGGLGASAALLLGPAFKAGTVWGVGGLVFILAGALALTLAAPARVIDQATRKRQP
jgi:hypothetical protein